MADQPSFPNNVAAPADPVRSPAADTLPGPSAPRRREQFQQPAGILPAAQSLLYVLIAALFLITFTVQPIRIPSGSMEPTLLVGDFLLLDKQATSRESVPFLPPSGVAHGDVIVFHDPIDDPSVHLVKRVIGIPGDRIHLREGVVFRNGVALNESYAVYRRSPRDTFRDEFPSLHSLDARVNPNWWIHLRSLVHDGEVTVPPGSYFVMGDNRNNSEDSRYWGFVPRDYIVGKPVLVYFSWREPSDDDPDPQQSEAAEHTGHSPAKREFVRWHRTFQVVH